MKKLSDIFFKPILLSFIFLALASLGKNVAQAASADGAGPWADSVVSSSQGLTKGGSPVSTARSNPQAAVGVAENTIAEGTFFSLGFGGNIVLGFDNLISGGVITVESTNPGGYPPETARVELSANGSTWYSAGSITQSGQVTMPQGLACAKYARITDTSDPSIFESTADGYDVDGVQAVGQPCIIPTPTPTPGCIISQSNVMNVNTAVISVSNTGLNTIKNSTGGTSNITTGAIKTKTSVTTTGGSNVSSGCGCCCNKAPISVSISANGTGSKNKIVIK
jgi:hypothetical protein